MSIFLGTAKTRFVDFSDQNKFLGAFIDKSRKFVADFLYNAGSGLYDASYVDSGTRPVAGYSNLNSSSANLKEANKRAFITQRPKATLFVKKRMFSSLAENHDVRFMNDFERLYIRTVKNLFQRKCDEIAFYESLVSIDSIYETGGFLKVDKAVDALYASVFSIASEAFDITNLNPQSLANFILTNSSVASIGDSSLDAATFLQDNGTGTFDFDRIVRMTRQLADLKQRSDRSKSSMYTSWIVDPSEDDVALLGYGVGVIELNLLSSIGSNVGLSSGSLRLEFEDPYKLMLITDADIEIAVRQSLRQEGGLSAIGLIDSTSGSQINLAYARKLDEELNRLRVSRSAQTISFEFAIDGAAIGKIDGTNISFDKNTLRNFYNPSVDSKSAFAALKPREYVRVQQIIDLLEKYNASLLQDISLFQKDNALFNPLRKRLRAEFLGHQIIQPMDVCHVFVNSNTRIDTPASGQDPDRMLTGSIINDLNNSSNVLSDEAIKHERNEIAPDVPYGIYKAMRELVIYRDDGVSISAGLVSSVNSNYQASSGKYSINVSCDDFTTYLKLSRFNTFPSLSQSDQLLYDPLTPFDFKSDPTTGLVLDKRQIRLSDENQKRLKLLRFNAGSKSGQRVGDEKDLIVDIEQINKKSVITFQHVPGIIYKWKEGIVTTTLNANSAPLITGSGPGLNDLKNDLGASFIDDPFGNLDAADIISILITGQPYSYSSFLRNAIEIGSFTSENANSSKTFFNYLFDFLGKTKSLYGNFIPAKNRVLNKSDIFAAFTAEQSILGDNQAVTKLTQDLVKLQTNLKIAGFNGSISKDSGSFENQSLAEINAIKQKILDAQASIDRQASKLPAQAQISLAGNKTFLQIDDKNLDSVSDGIKYRLKRKPEDVRFNQDKNFFIVSDKYDTDTNIRAFLANKGDKKFDVINNNDWMDIYQKVAQVSNQIDFEFFADHNGNLVFRPPEYNKTPMSLLVRLFEMAATDKVSLFPEFLTNLFTSRLDSTLSSLFRVELQIYEAILLGSGSLLKDISGSQFQITPALAMTSASDDIDSSIQRSASGLRYKLDEAAIIRLAQKDSSSNSAAHTATVFGPAGQLSFLMSNVLDSSSNKVITDTLTRDKFAEKARVSTTVDELIRVRKEIFNLDGITVIDADIKEQAQKDLYEANAGDSSSLTRFKISNNLKDSISLRQILIQDCAKLMTQYTDQNSINDIAKQIVLSGANFSRPILSDIFKGTQNKNVFPPYLADLIEDDFHNDEGFASGKRFIIQDDVILSLETTDRPPDFTQTTVLGGQNLIGESFGYQGGMPSLTANAVDFDMWRQYGFRSGGRTINRADFTNAETQCAPYAVFELLRERKNLQTASISLIGNEFYQVGDVVYVNSLGLLYYVVSVAHSIDLNSAGFTTTLELKYGRALGEYIPSPLDMIGKGLLNIARKETGFRIARNLNPSEQVQFIGTIFVPNYQQISSYSLDSTTRDNLIKAYGQTMESAVKRAKSQINVSGHADGRLEIRGYHVNEDTRSKTDAALDMVLNYVRSLDSVGDIAEGVIIKTNTNITEDVEEDMRFNRFPSGAAWAGAPSAHGVFIQDINVPVDAIEFVFVYDQTLKAQVKKPVDNLSAAKASNRDIKDN